MVNFLEKLRGLFFSSSDLGSGLGQTLNGGYLWGRTTVSILANDFGAPPPVAALG